jgi:uncharacterized protein
MELAMRSKSHNFPLYDNPSQREPGLKRRVCGWIANFGAGPTLVILRTMHLLITQKRTDIARICQRLHILKLEVFGSAARGTDFDPLCGDADFLVEFFPGAKQGFDGYFALKSELEQLLGREVDLVEPRSVRNPYLLAGINSSREVVYVA